MQPDRAAVNGFVSDTIGTAIHLVSIIPDGVTSGRWFDGDAGAATDWAVSENLRRRNIYWTVNRVRPGVNKKPGKSDIEGARFLHVDIDAAKEAGATLDIAETLSRLSALDQPPSFAIHSGGGVQAFWRIEDGAPALAVEGVNKGLIDLLGGDGGTWSCDHVMRLPGTVNWPDKRKIARGRQPALAHVLSEDGGASYPLRVLESAFPAHEVDAGVKRSEVELPTDYELLTADSLRLEAATEAANAAGAAFDQSMQ